MKKIILLVVLGTLVFSGIILTSMYFTYNNQEVNLRKESDAQRGKIEAVYDQMWKIIQQKSKVSDEYKKSFSEIYPKLIEGRYSQGDGTLMKWITESNPNFDVSLYKDLMNSIEIERNGFTTHQSRMLDIIRQHETLINTMPSKWFVSNKTSIEYVVISSTKSKEVMVSGEDNDIELFNN